MSELTLQPKLVASAYDVNKNGIVSDDLTIKEDKDTISALGGDKKVTVQELASAIANDRVVVKNGQVCASRGPVIIANLFSDVQNVHTMANSALDRTSSWYLNPPVYPRKADHTYTDATGKEKFDKNGYNDAVNAYRRDLQQYKNDLIADRYILVTTLQNIRMSTDDSNARRIVDTALNTQFFRDITNLVVDDNTKQRYEIDRALLRGALRDVATITEFQQPAVTLRDANNKVNAAYNEISKEQQAIDSQLKPNIDKAYQKIEKIKNGWMPFKGTRIKGVEKDIAEAKTFTTQPAMEQVGQLAKQAYEISVNALNWNSIDDARAISQKAQPVKDSSYNLQQKAYQEARHIEKLGK